MIIEIKAVFLLLFCIVISMTEGNEKEHILCESYECNTTIDNIANIKSNNVTESYLNDSIVGKELTSEYLILNGDNKTSKAKSGAEQIELVYTETQVKKKETKNDMSIQSGNFGTEGNVESEDVEGAAQLEDQTQISLQQVIRENSKVTEHSTRPITIKSSIETSTSVSSTGSTSLFPNLSKKSSHNPLNICICDRKVDECDINCCCDEDCTQSMREVFTSCDDSGKRTKSNVCFHSNSIFTINLNHKSYGNGLFCIVKTNYNSHMPFIEKIIDDGTSFKKKLQRKRIFSYVSNTYNEPVIQNKSYHIGDLIWVFHHSELIPFRIPKRSITFQCSSFHNVRYLVENSTQCVHSVPQSKSACEETQALGMNFYVKGVKIIKSPTSVNVSDINKVCYNETCINITSYVCPRSFENSDCIRTLPQNLTWNRGTCQNIVSSIEYRIYHNGTEGIKQVKAYFLLMNTTSSEKQFIQKISLRFFWVNKQSDVFVRSGNPGYLLGKPIMAGRKVFSNNETNSVRKEAIELSLNPEDWLSVTGTKNGLCITGSRKPIQFGENMRHTCSVRLDENVFTKKECVNLQDRLFNYLLGDDFTDVKLNNEYNKFVATFGNSKVEDTGDWARVIFDVFPILSSQVSSTAYYSSVVCKNIITDLSVDVAYSKIGSFEKPQNKILGVRFQLGNPRKFIFYNSYNWNVEQPRKIIKVSTSVRFIDVSCSPRTEFAETPGFEGKLPHDFFYPFFSKGCRFAHTNYVFVFVVFALQFFK